MSRRDPNLNSRPRRRLVTEVRQSEPNCWLCGQLIDLSLPPTHRWSSTIDEVIPRSMGGSAIARSNARHAHRHCNGARGNRPPKPTRSKLSRIW